MSEIARRSTTSDRQYKQAFAATVVVGIVLNLIGLAGGNGRPFTTTTILLGGAMSLLYLLLGVYDYLIFDRLPFRWTAFLFFSVECLLLLAIGWVLGNSGTWLMGLPLAGSVVTNLPPSRRWPVYVALVVVLILPTALLYEGWSTALVNSLNLGAAIFFVALFVQMRLKEQAGRQKAEFLTAQLESTNQQLIEYATQAKELATTQERHRLARELHDSVTQSLYSLTLLAAGWRRLAAKGQLDSVEESFAEIEDVAQQALKEMRLLIYELRPPALANEGLQGALLHRLNAVEKRAGVEARLVTYEVLDLPSTVEEALYAIAIEALNNALKHAAATRVTVQIQAQEGHIKMEVTDNGRGFDPQGDEENWGLGLRSMRERVEQCNGKLEIISASETGTCIKVEVEYER